MSNKPVVANELLIAVNQKIDKKHGKTKAADLKLFASQYYASTTKTEITKFSEQENYDSVLGAWDFIQYRNTNIPKIQFSQHKPDKNKQKKASTSVYILQDDMPFLVDSIRQTLNRAGANIKRVNHAVIHVERAAKGQSDAGKLKSVAITNTPGYRAEALNCISCEHLTTVQCKALEKEIKDTLKHVAAAVKDFPLMCKKAVQIRQSIIANAKYLPVSKEEFEESTEFISWLIDNHFTFLGYEEYRIVNLKQGPIIELQRKSLLGISRYKSGLKTRASLASLPKGTGDLILKKQICNFGKSATRSKVHRPAYYDYVLLKEFDKNGNVITEHRFVGLYTSSVYYRAALDIPLVRIKVNSVLDQSGFAPNGHSFKDLLQVINVFPREELFQISKEQLFTTALEITQIQQTRTSKLFIRKDSYGKFFSCLVYVPRDIYNTNVRNSIQEFLKENLQAEAVEFNTSFSESILARIHFVLRVPDIQSVKYNVSELESNLIKLIKPWDDHFFDALQFQHSDSDAHHLYTCYSSCFSAAYKEVYSAEEAVKDIARIERVVATEDLALDLESCTSEVGAELSFKIFSYKQQLFLSDVSPILENLGLNIISEKAFRLQPDCESEVWLHDFSLYRKNPVATLSSQLKQNFEEAFNAIWRQQIDDDSFNELVVAADMAWRDATLLRAYSAYLKQIQFGYSAQFVAETLSRHGLISQLLIRYFYCLFDPRATRTNKKLTTKIRTELLAAIDSVKNLSEDNVLRAFLNLLDATLRTNYFQRDNTGNAKNYFSFKFNPELIDGIPLPKPKYEIFVFSRQMEGVHLRGGKVARGGLRWSDRSEDYRTEVLGLVKAQQVKNSVIVPVGAKGGFIVKDSPTNTSREQFLQRGIECYKTFVCGLLDVTDNLKDGTVIPPVDVVCRDEDDPYLVVAADKGTATFSDIANAIAAEYEFWLGDGFASGGSNGYDHKQMGITAKGAWISVQRHFRELGINPQKQDITVVGIGDMSGDVFGNGMLLSKHIRLVAAFNHLHIFVDPNPDSARSFRERARLFKKTRSTWADYQATLISAGGGVFPRSAKSILVSNEMRARLCIDEESVTPDQLIGLILKSPVDLLWNGGIGTYIKSSRENHAEVGDKTNDAVRVDAIDLQCKVIGEGGNLGLTQAARIEFGLHGGISLTDFIDNSAGVDCSDHEVNIKILLNKLQPRQRLSYSKRNSLLQAMTDEVSELVLANNYAQVQTIGIAQAQMGVRDKEYAGLISYLENHAGLNRALEYLPDDEQLEERTARQQYLTRPEISVVTSYSKMYLKTELAPVGYLDDDYLLPYLYSAFPGRLRKRYKNAMQEHPLRREIIATQLANSVINLLGPSFIYRMVDSTGAPPCEVVKAAIIAKDIFQVENVWEQIEKQDYRIPANIQAEMMGQLIRLMRRVTRWLLRNRRSNLEFGSAIKLFTGEIRLARSMLPKKLPSDLKCSFQEKQQHLLSNQVPDELALQVTRYEFLFPVTSIIEISHSTGEKLSTVVDIYYAIGEELQLNWLGQMINQLAVLNYWQALARESFMDDLAWQHRALTCNVVPSGKHAGTAKSIVSTWAKQNNEAIERIKNMLKKLQAETRPDYPMFSVTLRELLNLAQSTAHES